MGCGLALGIDLEGDHAPASSPRRGCERNRREAGRPADFHDAFRRDATGQGAQKLRAGRLQVAMPLRLRQPGPILFELLLPKAPYNLAFLRT
jgi:hypothetical protein